MISIQIKLPWGRFYAHPWGLNPSRLREPEWPPSPWRLLRSLVSAWYKKHQGKSPDEHFVNLIEAMGRELPEIGIGKVSFGQTVHFQPNYGAANKEKESRAQYHPTRHENHFAAVSEPIYFRWQTLNLSEQHLSTLSELLDEISYFGRAESICIASICSSENTENIGWCQPHKGRKISASCRNVFCPDPDDFQYSDLWSKRSNETDLENAPKHLVDSLLSTDMRVDGAKWLSYQMPKGWTGKWLVRIPKTKRTRYRLSDHGKGEKIAYYLSFSLQCRVPVPSKFTVPISEKFRAAAYLNLCKQFGDGAQSFAISGHPNNRPENVEGDHQHAFYLPLPGRDKTINGISDLHIWCPYGFTRVETEMLLAVQRLDWGGGKYPIRPVLTAMTKEAPDDLPFSTGQSAARIWRNVTPFVPPRYFFRGGKGNPKLREKDRPELQLIECIKSLGISTPGEVRRLPLTSFENGSAQSRWDVVRSPEGQASTLGETINVPVHRNGKTGERKERRIGLFFEIEFDEPVILPFPSIGHSCHFGLGLLAPVPD